MVSNLFLFNFHHLGSYPNISKQAGALAVDKVSTARSLKEAKRVLSEALWPFGTDIWLSQHMNLHNLLAYWAYCIQKPSQVVFSTSYCCKNASKKTSCQLNKSLELPTLSETAHQKGHDLQNFSVFHGCFTTLPTNDPWGARPYANAWKEGIKFESNSRSGSPFEGKKIVL